MIQKIVDKNTSEQNNQVFKFVRRFDIFECILFDGLKCICYVNLEPNRWFKNIEVSILYPKRYNDFKIRNTGISLSPDRIIKIIGNAKENYELYNQYMNS